MDRFGEGTAFRTQVTNLDENDLPVVPTSLRYRIDCKTTGTNILGWTDLTPDDTVSIAITSSQNAIVNRSNLIERKTVTVEADAGLSTALNDDWDYEVRRLSVS